MASNNAVEIYFPTKYSEVITKLKGMAETKEISESKLFLDLLLIGASQAYPEVIKDYEPKHAR